MPIYHIVFDDHPVPPPVMRVWAETREQAILKPDFAVARHMSR